MGLSEQSVLVAGGTGSFGKRFIETVLAEDTPARLVVFSRDEYEQEEMRASGYNHDCLRYFLGDVRDKDRLYRAFDGVE